MSNVKLSYDRTKKYSLNIYAYISQNLRSYAGFVPMLRELLQNSDDSSDGEEVEIQIYFLKDKLKLRNNTIFKDNDWEKIREIASQNKEKDSQKTGRFGIGFTSVFKICDQLDIHSNNISERLFLENLEWVPHEEPQNTENYTEFDFFWRFEKTKVSEDIKAEVITPQKIGKYIDETLENIQKDIHFLRNVSKISIYQDEKLLQEIEIQKDCENLGQKLFKETKTITVDNKNVSNILIYHKDLTTDFDQEYKDGIARRDHLLLSLAISKSPLNVGRIFCTLPTEDLTDLAFDINSDFQPAPDRKHLIWQEDDEKGLYNLKLISFIPDILYEILDDLKNEISTHLFYKIISSASDTFENNSRFADNDFDFISEIRTNDSEIIFINKEWHQISYSKNVDDKSPILSFLERIEYPIIPYEYHEFSDFFDSIGVKQFNIDDFIILIRNEIPNSVLFDKSVFESKEELLNVFKYLKSNKFDNNRHNSIQNLNVFLTDDGYLHNKNQHIYAIPESLNLIQNDLTIIKIDNDLFNDFKDLLLRLGVQEFKRNDLAQILNNDFHALSFPIELSKSKPYLNSIEKLIQIIRFLHPCLIRAQEAQELINDASSNKLFDKKGELKHPQSTKNRQSQFEFVYKLPLVLSTEDQLYSIEYITYNLDSDNKKRFASKYNIQDIHINPKIKELLSKYNLSRNLDLKTIFNLVENGSQEYSKDLLILLYELIMEGEFQLKDNAIKIIIRTLPIFRNNKGNLCSLEVNGKVMKLPGIYSDPIGVEEILDENLIKSVPGFKQNILKRYFDIQELNFDVYIKDYFIDIFENEEVGREDKLQLIKTLMEQFHILERNDSFVKITHILKNIRFVYCQDSKFHYIHDDHLFFKSEEIDNFFGDNYLYPDFDENKSYEYLLEKLGIKKELQPAQIIEYIKKLIESKKLDEKLFEKLKNILKYIDEKRDNLHNKEKFKILANIEWLPAINDKSKLYKPSKVFTQDTMPFLSNLNGILYLDSKTPTRETIDYLELTNIQKIPIEKIIQNIRIASEGMKILDKYIDIYKELNRRVRFNKDDKDKIRELKTFPSFYRKYPFEDKHRYFSISEVFTKDCQKEFGFEYIGYLEPKLVEDCKELLKLLDISEEPTEDTLMDILEKIDFKYKKNRYHISSDEDKKIIENCLKRLNLYEILDKQFISELKNLHIFCNLENNLITPMEAILSDRYTLNNEFKDQLKEYLIPIQKEILSLIDQLEIAKLSQKIKKDLDVKPDSNLMINERFSKKLKIFNKLIPRIILEKKDLNGTEWKNIDPEITVYDFDKLKVTRNILWNGHKYISNKTNVNCFIDPNGNSLSKIYVRGSTEDILKSIVEEIFEELHPGFSQDFRGTIRFLLQEDSFPKMNEILTNLDYPILIENKDTSLGINKHIEEEYEDIILETEDGIEESEISLVQSKKDDDFNDKTINKPPTQQEKELEDIHIITENNQSKEIIKGRTKSPKTKEDLQNAFKESHSKREGQIHAQDLIEFNGIVEKSGPMSLEEREEFIEKIDDEHDTEIKTIQLDNIRREPKSRLESLRADDVAKSEVKSWYKNKCQICGYTFKKKDGNNHSNIVPLQPIRNKGIRHPSNLVCLCPNHAAIIKEGIIEFKNLDDLIGNKVIVEAKYVFKDKYINEIYEINYNPDHFLMLKSMLEYPSEPSSKVESKNISEKTDININIDPISLLKPAFDIVVKEDGWAFLSDLGQELRKLDYSFDPKNYGYKKLFELIKAYPNIFKVAEFENKKGPSIVKIRYKYSK